jgi:hypothetical protein
MTNFVQIQTGKFRALVRPKNLAKVEDKLAKVKPPVMDYGKITQMDRARIFPEYKPGMSTAEYVLNDKPAAQYNPSVPLCVEDTNPDYVPGVDDAPVKVKTPRRDAKAERITALESALKWVTACLINPHGSMDTWAAIENAQKVLK